jgi:hypothetical protein
VAENETEGEDETEGEEGGEELGEEESGEEGEEGEGEGEEEGEEGSAGEEEEEEEEEEEGGSSETGSAFVARTRDPGLDPKEAEILKALLGGDVPPFLFKWVKIPLSGGGHSGWVQVSPDYLAVGVNADFVRMPMQPRHAQQVLDSLDCLLPTKHLVDLIYKAAPAKIYPMGLPHDGTPKTMQSGRLYLEHNSKIESMLAGTPRGTLVAGHKKDVLIAKDLYAAGKYRGKLAFYGLFKPDGTAIQDFSTNAHGDFWVDYSHGIRLVHSTMEVDGSSMSVADVLADASLAPLLTGPEGVIATPRYPVP